MEFKENILKCISNMEFFIFKVEKNIILIRPFELYYPISIKLDSFHGRVCMEREWESERVNKFLHKRYQNLVCLEVFNGKGLRIELDSL